MRRPIGFFTWAYKETRAVGIKLSRWPLPVAIVLDLAVILYIFLAIVELVGYCAG